MKQRKKTIYEKYIKRLLDFIISLLAIIILLPVYMIVYILVIVFLGFPGIFKQKRPGKDEKIFTMYKFRTMTNKKDENGNLLPDEKRLTKFGKFLRSTSLDELPELFNILKGDMSIIGPRPQLVRDMVFMTNEQRKRHTIRPGLSGLAQVNGRNTITWEDKLDYDLQYLKKITFIGDVKLVMETILKVFKREGIVREGTASDMDFGDYLLLNKKINNKLYKSKISEAEALLNNKNYKKD